MATHTHTPSGDGNLWPATCTAVPRHLGSVSISSSRLEKFMKAEIDYFAQKSPQPVGKPGQMYLYCVYCFMYTYTSCSLFTTAFLLVIYKHEIHTMRTYMLYNMRIHTCLHPVHMHVHVQTYLEMGQKEIYFSTFVYIVSRPCIVIDCYSDSDMSQHISANPGNEFVWQCYAR